VKKILDIAKDRQVDCTMLREIVEGYEKWRARPELAEFASQIAAATEFPELNKILTKIIADEEHHVSSEQLDFIF
jgi:hypothetical protein